MKKQMIFIIMIIMLGVIFSGCAGNDDDGLQIETYDISLNDNADCINVFELICSEQSYTLNYNMDFGGEGDFDVTRFRPLFYSLPYMFSDIVGAEVYFRWRASRSFEEYQNENVAVSFIRYFNISREDFERANEKWIAHRIARGREDISGYPVDLIFTFDNERINYYFRWHNSSVPAQRDLGIYPEAIIPSVAINITPPMVGLMAESEMPHEERDGGNFWVVSTSWSPEITPFASNTEHTVTAVILARFGYTFTGMQSATINGNPAVISHNTGITARISYTFTDGGGVGPGPTSVTVYSPWGWSGQFECENDVAQLRARVLPSNANQTVVWSSTNPDLIDVDQAGNVQIVQLCCCMRGGSSIFIRATAVDGTFGSFNVWANDRLMRTADYCENY